MITFHELCIFLIPISVFFGILIGYTSRICIKLQEIKLLLNKINDKLPDNSWTSNYSQNPTEQNRQIIQLLQDIKRGVMK